VRNLATQALNELRGYFATGAPAPSWTITPHTASGGTWYELDPGDPTVVPALITCGRIAAATADDLAKRGLDGKTVPELNYAKATGIYLVRPARPGGRPAPSPQPAASP
jgi:hypothetical protein